VFTGVYVSPSQWHSCLGHPATPIVCHVIHGNDLPFSSSHKELSVCDACQQGKIYQLPFLESSNIVTTLLEINFFECMGPCSNLS
jgi:hypothetical protein